MKISKSKQELARIISENGGWRDGAESAAQSSSDNAVSFYLDTASRFCDRWYGKHMIDGDIEQDGLISNWHQTVLSRAEYFHLYPALGELCGKVTEENRHEPAWTNPPSIEQLAADYRNAKDCAERKQQEADDAKADAEAKLKALEIAGEAIGLTVSPITAKQEPELVITNRSQLELGDVIWLSDSTVKENNELTPSGEYTVVKVGVIGVESDGQTIYPDFSTREWRFISRP